MIQLIGYAFLAGIAFIIVSPIILFLLAFLDNALPSTRSAEPFPVPISVPTEPVQHMEPVKVQKPKKSKPKTPIHTVSPEPVISGSIKEFTLPDGSKIAIDCEKVEMEEKKMF